MIEVHLSLYRAILSSVKGFFSLHIKQCRKKHHRTNMAYIDTLVPKEPSSSHIHTVTFLFPSAYVPLLVWVVSFVQPTFSFLSVHPVYAWNPRLEVVSPVYVTASSLVPMSPQPAKKQLSTLTQVLSPLSIFNRLTTKLHHFLEWTLFTVTWSLPSLSESRTGVDVNV